MASRKAKKVFAAMGTPWTHCTLCEAPLQYADTCWCFEKRNMYCVECTTDGYKLTPHVAVVNGVVLMPHKLPVTPGRPCSYR